MADRVSPGTKPEKLHVGIPMDYNVEEIEPAVRRAWQRSIDTLKDHGHVVIPVQLPTTKHALSAYYVLAPAEASSNLARFDGVRYGSRAEESDGDVLYAQSRSSHFGEEVKSRILLGTFSLSAAAVDNYFIQAQKIRRMVQNDFNAIFALAHPLLRDAASASSSSRSEADGQEKEASPPKVDILLCPTAPNLPPTIDSLIAIRESAGASSPIEPYLSDVFTVPASLAGLPAISVPVEMDEIDRRLYPDVASAGIQVIGQYGDDAQVLSVAELLEQWLSPRRSIQRGDEWEQSLSRIELEERYHEG